MQYHTIQWNDMKTMGYHKIQRNSMQYHTMPCNTMESIKIWFSGHFWAKKGLLQAPWSLLSNINNTKTLSFWCLVMMVTKKLEDVHKIMISGQKTAFLGPKRATLGNRGRETARRAAKRPSTGKLKLSSVTSGYVDVMISLSQVRLSPKKRDFIGVA